MGWQWICTHMCVGGGKGEGTHRLVSLVNVSGADHDGGIEPVKSL